MELTEKNTAGENEAVEDKSSLAGVDALSLAEEIAKILDSKKGREIKVLHVEDKTVIAEYFVLCTGTSNTHIKALAGEVEFKTEERELSPYGIEGRDNNSWIILDYSHVIVHIFSREAREFYNLDKLYED